MPTKLSTGTQTGLPSDCQSVNETYTLTHHEKTSHQYALHNDKIDKVHNVKNRNWKEIHDSMIVDKNRDLFELDSVHE